MGRILSACIVIIFGVCCSVRAYAQYYDTGTDPAAVKWRTIKDGYFTVIYPEEIDSLAQRYVWLLHNAYRPVTSALRPTLRNIPVVLHPYTVNSNGAVVWTPRRMELYTTPPVTSYAQPWDKQLVLHETRHVAQMFKLREGNFKYLHVLIGEQSEGLAAGLYPPGWYLEGDAVVSETAGSSSGRGRQPEFLMPYKAYYLNNYKFAYDVWKNDSYRYLIPSKYEMGYAMSAYAYMKTDRYIFAYMNEYAMTHPFNIPPTGWALHKYGGFFDSELHEQAFAFLDSIWRQEDVQKQTLPVKPITTLSTDYKSYRTPVPMGNGKLMALKTDLAKTPRLVLIDSSGAEKMVRHVGNVNSALSAAQGKVYWTESVPHARWELKSYSIVKSYDKATDRTRILSHRTRYFSVAASSKGEMLAVVENAVDGKSFLLLLDAESGNVLQRTEAPWGATLKELAWGGDAAHIYATIISDAGMGLQRFDLQQQRWETMIPETSSAIHRPSVAGEQVFFESGYNGANNIYAMDISSGKIYLLTDARFGAFDPEFLPDKKKLLFADYSDKGYSISELAIDQALWRPVSFTTPCRYALADSVAGQMNFNIDTLRVPEKISYESKKYNRFTHLFRVHSWAPFYFSPDAIEDLISDNMLKHIGLGASVFSQNTLGSAITFLGYQYHSYRNTGHFSFIYQGWYPVFELQLDVNDRARERHNLEVRGPFGYQYLIDTAITTSQPYCELFTRMYIPFNLTRGAWQTVLLPQLEYHFTNDEFSDSYIRQNYSYYQFIRSGVTFYRRLPMSLRDLYPRWGFMMRALNSLPVADGRNFKTISSVQLTTYSPGILVNHSLVLTGGYQWQSKGAGRYLPFSHLSFPRGYTTTASQQLMTASATYAMPLCCPDWNLGYWFYLKRVQMALFADYGRSEYRKAWTNMLSAGFDLSMDFHFLRIGAPINMGVRCIFPKDGSPSAELLMNVKIN